MALVERHAVVADDVRNLLSVGRGSHAAYTSHGPKGFGRQAASFDSEFVFSDKRGIFFRFLAARTACGSQ